MRLVSLNTWHAQLRESLHEYLSRAAASTDIFCFQEAGPATRTVLRSWLPGFHELGADKYINNDFHFHQAIFLAPHVRLAQSQVLMQDPPDVGLALHALIASGDTQVAICNVHGVSYHKTDDKLDTPGRLAQTRAILDFYAQADYPQIITGDFNMDPQAKSIQDFAQAGYRNLILEYGIKTTRNHYVWDRYPGTRQFFADFMFAGPGLSLDAFTVPASLISDHQPMVADFSLPVTARK